MVGITNYDQGTWQCSRNVVVVGDPSVRGGDFVGLKWNAEIILNIDQNRGETRVILSHFLLSETWRGAFYRQK